MLISDNIINEHSCLPMVFRTIINMGMAVMVVYDDDDDNE